VVGDLGSGALTANARELTRMQTGCGVYLNRQDAKFAKRRKFWSLGASVLFIRGHWRLLAVEILS